MKHYFWLQLSQTFGLITLYTLLLFMGACSSSHTYVTPSGAKVETSDIGLQTMAVRDMNIATEASYNDAVNGASDVQAVALMANKLTQRGQKIEREPTVSEEAREWAGLFLRYFGGGIDVNNRRKTQVHSEVYNINGSNNSMAGIHVAATSQSGAVTQSLTSDHTVHTEETIQTWNQRDTVESANGEASVETTKEQPEEVKE